MDLTGKIEGVIKRVDEIASDKGLRAAQRRALARCRNRLSRLLRSLEKTGGAKASEVKEAVFDTVAETCELLNAYFCKKG